MIKANKNKKSSHVGMFNTYFKIYSKIVINYLYLHVLSKKLKILSLCFVPVYADVM